MKKLIVILVLFFAVPAFADYTIELKNESGVTLKTYPVTAAQVQHLQKTAALTGKSVINQIKEAISYVIRDAKALNKARWLEDNNAYIEEQARQMD